ncbi:hypothetical protein KIN20_029214 [Parelaphostrongylus tenuis]|uniref:Uncharacterized protein n=1 Tax=Parelaphostrongylus tenuis TaxID=148309 RepID=A0AAD5R216_PARTN|nr:hypothetical protein KIN20_029214 [Parelaphostrongylus tenuis]
MHLTLCSCFQSLRRENYIVVWSNLIYKRYTKYPNHTYKELYFALYGVKGTKAERELQRMDTIEMKEKERSMLKSEIDSSSDEDDGNEIDDLDYQDGITTMCGPGRVIPEVIAQEEAECRKYVYVGQAADSQADLQLMLDILAPNYTNTYDVLDEKKRERRAKRDRKALTQRLRRRRREELRELARQERRYIAVFFCHCIDGATVRQ